MENISILKNFTFKNYYSYPYPFFFIDQAYDNKTYSLLENDYKIFHLYFQKNTRFKENNIRLQISTEEFYNSKLFQNSIWNDFINYHTSKEFFSELVKIFEKDLEVIYPHVMKEFRLNYESKNFLNIRNDDNKKNYKFVADCQPGINTPTTLKNSVRESHIDNSAELIAGLFYLKESKDQSIGGDFQIMEIEKKKRAEFHKKSEVKNNNDLRLFKEIKYSKNKVVFFVNSPKSIHRVTPRSETSVPRNLTNIIFETYHPECNLFSNGSFKNNVISKIKRLLRI